VPRQSSIDLSSECSEEERALIGRILGTGTLSDRHLEIGTAAGGTLKEMIGVYADRETCPQFVVIDPFTYYDNQLEKVRTNLTGAGIDPDSVQFWTGTTQSFIDRERKAGGTFDFVFIDGDHRHYPVMIDLQWADLLRPGGFICLHDRSEKFPGVGWAIDRFLAKNPDMRFVEQAETLVALQKTGPGRPRGVTSADLRAAWAAQLARKWKRSIAKRMPGR
jgi:SAM-dependent methyltransferase